MIRDILDLVLARTFHVWLWMCLLTAGVLGPACIAVSEWNRLWSLPTSPTVLTLAELAKTKVAPQWIELRDAIPLCDHSQTVRDHDVVPVFDKNEMGLNPDGPAVLIGLQNHEFCAQLPTPLRLAPSRRSGYAQALIRDSRWPHPIMHDDVFELSNDPISIARVNIVVLLLVSLTCFLCIAWLRRGKPASAGVTNSIKRPKQAGALELIAVGITCAGLSLWGMLGAANDLRAWHRGVEVNAELKGNSRTGLLASVIHIKIVYSLPDEDDVHTANRMFMTLFRPDDDVGQVRALPDAPEIVTFEEAIDLLPLRIPLLLTGLVGGIWMLRLGLKKSEAGRSLRRWNKQSREVEQRARE